MDEKREMKLPESYEEAFEGLMLLVSRSFVSISLAIMAEDEEMARRGLDSLKDAARYGLDAKSRLDAIDALREA